MATKLIRFLTVARDPEAADVRRHMRGFALESYAEESTWDLVGNSSS
jgi:catalase